MCYRFTGWIIAQSPRSARQALQSLRACLKACNDHMYRPLIITPIKTGCET